MGGKNSSTNLTPHLPEDWRGCLYNIILGREIDWIGRNAYFGEKHKFRLNSEWRFYCCNELFKSDEYKNSGNNYLRILEIILNL